MQLPHIEGIQHTYVSVNNITFHVATIGQGKPVVLLHGWPQHWYVWRKLIPLLSKKYQLIMPDLPGLGWSDAPPNYSYRKEQIADDLLLVLNKLNLKEITLVGHDWGGWIGFLMCSKKPEYFSNYVALGITNPFAISNLSSMQNWRFFYQLPIAMPLIGKSLLRYLPFLIEWGIKHCSYLKYSWAKTDLRYYSSVLQNQKKALASSLLYRTFLEKELISIYLGKYKQQRLTVPTHLLIGENDPIINPAVFKHADQNDTFKMIIVPKCGHFIPEEKPEVVAALINTF